MAPHILKTAGVILAVLGLVALAAPMQAQQWGGLEEFNTLNTLPPGWAKSPHGVGAASPNNVWNVDANPTQSPGANPLQITPARSGQYSLNWNDGDNANPGPGTQHIPPVEAGVLSPVVDITFAPTPVLSFYHNYHRYTADPNHHIMWVRIWDENLTTKYTEQRMPLGQGVLTWQHRTVTLSPTWGRIRVEFCYICGANYQWEEQAAGWYIDDVDFTGLLPLQLGISNPANLPAQTAGDPFSFTMDAQNGNPPYTWSFVPQTPVPPGLTLSPTGSLDGPVTHSGIYKFKIRVEDTSSPPLLTDKEFTLPVNRPSTFQYPVMSLPFMEDFSNDQGWVYSVNNVTYGPSLGQYTETSTGLWQRGATVASAPANAGDGGDPAQDHSPTSDNMLLGVNIGATIPTNIAINSTYWAYSPQIQVGGHRELVVSFWRWINVGNISYHQTSVEIWRPQTSTWLSVWSVQTGQAKATSWTKETVPVDFGSSAGSGATTRLRIGYRVTNQNAFAPQWIAGGANIDDIEIIAKPQTGLLNITQFEVVSPHTAGSPITYVGSSYPVVLALENTTGNDIALFSLNPTYLAHNGSAWVSVNVGSMDFVPGPAPSASSPLIIPPGVHYVSYDVQNPPAGAGAEIGHIDFNCTAAPPQGHTSSTYVDLVIYGSELGGAGRSTVSYTYDPVLGATPHRELIDVRPPPPFSIADPTTLPDASVNTLYQYTLSAQHGVTPYHSWAITNAPAYVTMNGSTIEFTATPNDVPNPPVIINVSVEVFDSTQPTNQQAVKTFNITILPAGATLPPLQIATPNQLPPATELTPYSPITFNATGGQPPYTWIAFQWLGPPAGLGTLHGMIFDLPSGTFGGTPNAGTTGLYAFNLTVQDSNNPASTRTETFYIAVLPLNESIIITTPTTPGSPGAPPPGKETLIYNGGLPFKFTADGGVKGPPGQEYLWTLVSGALPDGLTLNAQTGELSGTPTLGGNFVFALRASDGAFPPARGTATFEIEIEFLIPTPLQISTIANLPDGEEGNPYSVILAASYGKTPYTWRVKQGSTLPLGLGLDAVTGELIGVPEKGQAADPSQEFTFTIEVVDSATIPEIAEKEFRLTLLAFVDGPLAFSTPANLTQGGVFNPYSVFIRATGGSPVDPQHPYFFGVKPDSKLPTGLTLEANGLLHGKPGAEGTHKFTIEVYDGSGGQVEREFTLQVNGSGGSDGTVEIKRGKSNSRLVPFWEACSVGSGSGSLGLLLMAALGAGCITLRRRRA